MRRCVWAIVGDNHGEKSEHPLMFIQSFYLGGAWHNPVIIGLPEGESVFKVTDRAKLTAAQFPLKML